MNYFLFVLSVILMILSSFPSMVFYGFFIGALYFLFINQMKFNLREYSSLIVLTILTLLVLIIPLYYTYEFLSFNDLAYRENKGLWKLPLKQMVSIINPLHYGEYFEIAKHKLAFNNGAMYNSIFFAWFLICNFIFLFFKDYRNKYLIVLTLLNILCLALIYDLFNILTVFSKLPVFSTNPSFRIAGVWNILAVLITILGIHKIKNTTSQTLLKVVKIATLLSFVLGVSLLYLLNPVEQSGQGDLIFQVVILEISLAAFYCYLKFRQTYQNIFLGVLCLCSFIMLKNLGGDYNSYYKKDTLFPRTTVIEFLDNNLGKSQKVITIGRNLIPHTNLFHGIGSIQSHWWLSKGHKTLMQQVDPKYKSINPTLDFFESIDLLEKNQWLDMMNVKYIITNRETARQIVDGKEFRIAFESNPSNTIIENSFLPYVNSSYQDKLCDTDLYYNYLHHDNKFNLVTNFCDPQKLTLPISSYPGWKVEINDKPANINSYFDIMSLDIPEGSATIKGHFSPSYFLTLSGITVLSIILIIFLSYVLPISSPIHKTSDMV